MARTFTMARFGICACLAAPAFAQDFPDSFSGGDWVFGTCCTAITIGGNGATDDDERGDTTGFRFTVGSEPISVTAIGFWDSGEDGFDSAHDVGIFRQSDEALIVRSTVLGGVDARLTNQFRYVDITPTVLEAGVSYQVVGFRPPGSGLVDLVGFNFDQFRSNGLITYDGDIFENNNTELVFATTIFGVDGIFGTNMEFNLDSVPPCVACDTNCDDEINSFDIEPFIALLFDQNLDPCCGARGDIGGTGDTNGDGLINSFDIEGFLECLFP